MVLKYRLYVVKCRLRHEAEMGLIDFIEGEMRKEQI